MLIDDFDSNQSRMLYANLCNNLHICYSGGMSNMLFLCELLSDGEEIDEHQSSVLVPNRVLLRIYCDPDPDHHLTESVIFTLLSERRLGPRLYGVFSGGRFEEFIPSRCLSCAELAVPR